LKLSVKDNGIGIPRDKLTEIFELFTQVERTGGRAGGLGIGLTLVRQIAALHGGSIEAYSDGLGHGSEFVLTVPIVAISPDEQAPARVTGPDAMQRRILVVDDNRDAAESLAVLLQLAGHEVEYVLDGKAAVALAEQTRPEVVFLDLGMPIMNGYEVARRIRAQPWGKRTYLVALSGWGQADERQRTKDAGFHAHLVKPVAPEAISRLLEVMTGSPADTALT
jgi:CheY-like chemotaxis protein